jgi:hypothetical protein
MPLTAGTCALLRGDGCHSWSCTVTVLAVMFLTAAWHIFGFESTVADRGWRKAFRDYWPIVVVVGVALVAVLTHNLGLW